MKRGLDEGNAKHVETAEREVREMYHPYLVGDKVYLRSLEREDLKGNMFQWANDPEVTHFMYMGTFPNTIEALEHEYEVLMGAKTAGLLQLPSYPTDVVFAVIDKESDSHIGNAGFFGINWITRAAEFRAIIGEKAYWGGGYAFETYCLAIEYAFDRLNLRRLCAGCRADHFAAVMAMKRVGFVQEGRQREHFQRNEQAYDILLFGLLRDEYFALFSQRVPQPPGIPRKER